MLNKSTLKLGDIFQLQEEGQPTVNFMLVAASRLSANKNMQYTLLCLETYMCNTCVSEHPAVVVKDLTAGRPKAKVKLRKSMTYRW